jgi:excisionase family DNA binding protein
VGIIPRVRVDGNGQHSSVNPDNVFLGTLDLSQPICYSCLNNSRGLASPGQTQRAHSAVKFFREGRASRCFLFVRESGESMIENPSLDSASASIDQHQLALDFPRLITVTEAAQLLRMSRSAVYQYINRGEIPIWRASLGHRRGIRIPIAELKARIEAETVGAAKVAA